MCVKMYMGISHNDCLSRLTTSTTNRFQNNSKDQLLPQSPHSLSAVARHGATTVGESLKGGVTLLDDEDSVFIVEIGILLFSVSNLGEHPLASSQLTSGKPEHTVLELADLICTFSKLLVMLTVVLRGAGISEACDSTS